MKRVLLLVALLVGAVLCAPSRAQTCDPCTNDLYANGVYGWSCLPGLPLPCNVSNFEPFLGGECNTGCDTDNTWPNTNWMQLRLGANCVAVGKHPDWLFAVQGVNSLPNPTTVLVSLDIAPLLQPVPINWSFEPNQVPPFAIGNTWYSCSLSVPFAAYDTVTVPGASAPFIGNPPRWVEVPWGFALPNNPALTGVTIWSQAIAIYGLLPHLAISNTIYMTIIHDI